MAEHADLSPTAKLVLWKLRETDDALSRKTLENELGEDKYAILRGVKELRKEGLIVRSRDRKDLRRAVYALAEPKRCR